MEGSFDLLLAVTPTYKIVNAHTFNGFGFGKSDRDMEGIQLDDFFSQENVKYFYNAISESQAGRKCKFVYSPKSQSRPSAIMRVIRIGNGGEPLFLFFGDQLGFASSATPWEGTERAKELSCVYAIAQWIEDSASIEEFFRKLPEFLAKGMHYPNSVKVFSEYQEQSYGTPPDTKSVLRAKLKVSDTNKGFIAVWYDDPTLNLLEEEQKMLNEIVRMLNLALERKELKLGLAQKKKEEAEYSQRVRKLEKEIANRSKEIEAQKHKLDVANSYLDRINRDLGASKVRLDTIFKAIPDRVAIIDINRNVVMTNRETVATGNKCYKTFFDHDAPCQDCRLARVIREQRPIRMEIQDDDGEYFEVQAIPIFNDSHEVGGILEFYKNITLEKTYEQQLLQADKLASLGQLVSGIGHEINNPNQFIRGNIKIIKQSMEDMLPIVDDYCEKHPDKKIARLKYSFFRKHIMTLINDMEHGSIRIKGIVEGLKRFARKDEGLLIDTVEINTLINASARLVHNQVHKYADINLSFGENIPVFPGNSQKIEQVIINLIINASQATVDGRRGVIDVQTRFADEHVIIEVKDNGKGMSQRTLKRIFDPFFTTRRARGGTGLGLPIAYRICEEHGGMLSVSSKVGVGTTFTIRIPVKGSQSDSIKGGK